MVFLEYWWCNMDYWTGDLSQYDGILWESWSWNGIIRHVIFCQPRQRSRLRMGQQKRFVRLVRTEEKCIESLLLADD